MSEEAIDIVIDLGPLKELAGGDESFVAMLLLKMTMALPESYGIMEQAVGDSDWETLRASSHKAKSTFAYLSLDEMKNKLRDIEHDARELLDQQNEGQEVTDTKELPARVADALVLGRKILAQLEAEHAKLS